MLSAAIFQPQQLLSQAYYFEGPGDIFEQNKKNKNKMGSSTIYNYYASIAMGAMSLRTLPLIFSTFRYFRNFNLVHHFFASKYYR